MIWQGETQTQKQRRLEKWHRFTPWFPVQCDTGEWVWLETCWRRFYWWHGRVQYSTSRDRPEDEFFTLRRKIEPVVKG